MKKVATISLGCPKNLTDTEIMLGKLVEAGYQLVADTADADVLLINTCAFLESARSEAYEVIEECVALKENGSVETIVVAGCLPVQDKKALQKRWPQIDYVIGPAEVYTLASILKKPRNTIHVGSVKYNLLPASRVVTTSAGSAYIKIAEGCDNHCSFCSIPQLRGPFRSKSDEIILAEAETLVAGGVKEIVLVAQDTTAWGKDFSGKLQLPALIKKMVKISGLEWIRILYAYPSHISDELIAVMEIEPKVCKYLDLPLQHIDDEILQSMKRQATEKETREVIAKLRIAMPEIALRTTFIVGYPGEREEHFEKLKGFVEEMQFTHVGVFTYSREQGTSAALLREQVAEDVKTARYEQLMQLQRGIAKEQNEMLVGKELQVLVDRPHGGRSFRDAPDIDGSVIFDDVSVAPVPGSIVTVRITRASHYDLGGTVVT